MKLLITSDIHRNLTNLNVVKAKYPNHYHLDAGDAVLDEDLLSKFKVSSVRGNCDYNYHLPLFKVEIVNDLKILVTHGHLLAVKHGVSELIMEANRREVNVVIFGHTHIPYLNIINNVTFINPGSLNEGKYAVYEKGEFILREL